MVPKAGAMLRGAHIFTCGPRDFRTSTMPGFGRACGDVGRGLGRLGRLRRLGRLGRSGRRLRRVCVA